MNVQKLGGELFRYFIVGVINFLVATAVLNLFAWLTHTYKGPMLFVFTSIAFTVSVFNSYFLNRSWTFKNGKRNNIRFPLFCVLTLMGLAIGSAVIFIMTTWMPAPSGVSAPSWLNVANVVATGVGALWNFATYRQIVFQPSAEAHD